MCSFFFIFLFFYRVLLSLLYLFMACQWWLNCVRSTLYIFADITRARHKTIRRIVDGARVAPNFCTRAPKYDIKNHSFLEKLTAFSDQEYIRHSRYRSVTIEECTIPGRPWAVGYPGLEACRRCTRSTRSVHAKCYFQINKSIRLSLFYNSSKMIT